MFIDIWIDRNFIVHQNFNITGLKYCLIYGYNGGLTVDSDILLLYHFSDISNCCSRRRSDPNHIQRKLYFKVQAKF